MKKTMKEIQEEFPSWVWGRILDLIPGSFFTADDKTNNKYKIKVDAHGEIEVSPFLENNLP